MEMTAFHGTSSIFKNEIHKYGLDPERTDKRQDHWLGQGVYFYDRELHAKWWAGNSVKKHDGYGVVYRVSLNSTDDAVLDLDDPLQLDEFLDFVVQLAQAAANEDYVKGMKFTQEQYRAIAFDYYKIKNDVDVIIATFSKNAASYLPRYSHEELQFRKRILEVNGLGYKERQICVSAKDVIKDITIIYDEENEVV